MSEAQNAWTAYPTTEAMHLVGGKKKKKQHLIEMTVLNDISMNAFVNKFYHPRITNKVHLTISGSKSGRAAFKLTIKIQENI